MREAVIDDMELGNAIFGNSRGKYHVEPRTDYQDVFCDFLRDNGFDMYGYRESHVHESDDYSSIDNDVFTIRPYYWGEDESITELPNFVYKPIGLEIQWYKYPMRDAYSNQDIDLVTFAKILEECAKSLRS